MLYRNFSKLQLFLSELGSAYIITVVTTSESAKSVFIEFKSGPQHL